MKIALVGLTVQKKIGMPFVYYLDNDSKPLSMTFRWPWEKARDFDSDVHNYTYKWIEWTTNPLKVKAHAYNAAQVAYVTATFKTPDRYVSNIWHGKDTKASDAEKGIAAYRKAAKLQNLPPKARPEASQDDLTN